MLTSKRIFTTITLLFFGFVSSQVILDGPCPTDINVKFNFNVQKYLGTWYEYAKYPTYFEANGRCVTAKYYLAGKDTVEVINSMINITSGDAIDIFGTAQVIKNAKLLVKFPVSHTSNVTSNYWVLDTDYKSYSVVYSCEPISSTKHATIVWILTRQRNACSTVIRKAENVLLKNDICLDSLIKTNQTSCD